MKRSVLIYALLNFLAVLFIPFVIPWWWIPILTAIIAVVVDIPTFKAFLISFSIAFVVWIGIAIWQNTKFYLPIDQILSELFGGTKTYFIYILTGIIGGIISGLGALTGRYFKLLLGKNPNSIA
ncbi:MAG: hypothetical protein KDC04_06430 [Saprospiraceae bacterium]|nr:hypothetical protein [Saprospiraceae bacterium]